MRTTLVFVALVTAHVAAQEPRGTVTTIAGESFPATIAAIDGGVVRFVGTNGAERDVPLDELDVIEVGGTTPPVAAEPGRIWLRSGTSLGANVLGGSERGVKVDVGLGPPQELAFVHVRALRFEAADAAGDYDGFARALEDPDATDDFLFAWNRRTGKLSRLSVRVLGLEEDALRVDYRGERTVPLDQVHGIVFGRDNGVVPPAPPLPSAVVSVAGGVKLAGTPLDSSGESIRLRLPEDATLELPVETIERIDVRSSRVLRLSAVPPDDVVQIPAFDRVRPWLVDRAPGGPGLEVGRQRFARGLCLIPRTRLTWRLEPHAFDVFESTIGIDARSTGPADAVFRVLLDGEVAFEQQHVGPGFVETVRVPLDAATTLSLEVDFGERLDLGDHCAFADARLLKL